MRLALAPAALALIGTVLGAGAAAQMSAQPIAVMQGLDKITARISRFDVPVDKPQPFGTLSIIVRDCEKSAPEARPENVFELHSSVLAARALLDRELTDTEKQVFIMHYGDDVPLLTITRLLGLENPSGAKAYLVSARRKLARALSRLRASERLTA